MAHLLKTRIMAATGAFALGVGIALAAAQAGEFSLGAGGVEMTLARGDDSALHMKLASRECTADCNLLDFDWQRDNAKPTLLILSANTQ